MDDKYTVLMMETDLGFIRDYRDALNLSGWFIAKATNSLSTFISEARNAEYDVYVVDIHIEEIEDIFDYIETVGGYRTGVVLLHYLRGIRPDAKVVAFSSTRLPEAREIFENEDDDSVDFFSKFAYEDCKLFVRDLYESVLKYFEPEKYEDFIGKRRMDLNGVLAYAYSCLKNGDNETALSKSRTALDIALQKICYDKGIQIYNKQMKDLNLILYNNKVYDLITMEQVKKWTMAGNDPTHGKFGKHSATDIRNILNGVKRFAHMYIDRG